MSVKEYALSKELLIAGTHIGKHVKEAVKAPNPGRPFTSEMNYAFSARLRRPNTGCS